MCLRLSWITCCVPKRRRLLTTVAFTPGTSASAREIGVVQAFNPLHGVAGQAGESSAAEPAASYPVASMREDQLRAPSRRLAVIARDDATSQVGGEVHESAIVASAVSSEPRSSWAPGASRAHLHASAPPDSATAQFEPSVAGIRERRQRRSTRADRLTQIVELLGPPNADPTQVGSAPAAIPALEASCKSMLKLTKPADVSRVIPVLHRMLHSAAAPADCRSDSGESSAGGAEAVETLCRTLISFAHRFPGSATGTAALVARAMAAHGSHAAAMEQACWLVGDLVTQPGEMGGFLEAGGARSLVGILAAGSQCHAPGTPGASLSTSAATITVASAAASAAAAQTLVAMCSVAADSAGAATLVVAGAVPVVVSTMRELADADAAVAEAGCRVLRDLLGVGSAASRRDARRALVAHGGVEVLLQQLISKCVTCPRVYVLSTLPPRASFCSAAVR